MFTVVLSAILSVAAFGQETVKVDKDIENKILIIQHKIDQATLAEAQAQLNFGAAQGELQRGEKEKEAAIESAWKESKLSKDDDELNINSFTFVKKPKEKSDKPEVKK